MNDLELCYISGHVYIDTPSGSVNGLEYKIYSYESHRIIAVRGTEPKSLTDVIRDLRAWPWRNKVLGWGHCGFIRGAVRVYADILKEQDRKYFPIDEKTPLIFTGHSLGAAVSMKVAKLFHRAGYNVQDWVGFGCPRGWIGERELGFPARTYVNGDDPVTKIPVGWVFDYQLPKDVEQIYIGKQNGLDLEDISDHRIWGGYYLSLSKYLSGGI